MKLKNRIKAKKKITLCVLVALLIMQCVFTNYTVKADNSVYLEITGYQMSYALQGYRTLYSVVDPENEVEEVGLIYGITDKVTDDDMVVGSTSETVYSFAATPQGIASANYTKYEGATTYIITMELIKKVEFYNTSISVRAYAKLKDDSYIYTDISTMTVYSVSSTLYNKCLMPNIDAHNYLYNNILTLINPSYKFVDYNWGGAIIPPKSASQGEPAPVEEAKDIIIKEDKTAETVVYEEITTKYEEITSICDESQTSQCETSATNEIIE